MLEHYWENLKVLLWNGIWAVNVGSLPRGRAGCVRCVRVVHMLLRELSDGQLNLRAASLVYTTLLSLIPVLAVTFWVLKGFDAHRQVEPMLVNFLEPLGDKGLDIGVRIIEFVENLKIDALGSMGLAVLILMVISLLYKIEKAFNYTWRVTKPRGFAGRLSGYLTVVMVGPVLVFTAMGIVAAVMRHALVQEALSVAPIGVAIGFAGKLVPYVLIITAFAFIYFYMPNTKVRVRSALVGALVAGCLWASAGWLFASLVVTSARYTAIYSSFAIVILFMMWLYIAWLILLAGASVAFYHQYPEYLGLLMHEVRLSARLRERIALNACFLIGANHYHGRAPWTVAGLARHLNVPLDPLKELLQGLERAALLLSTGEEGVAYVPARDLGSIRVTDVLRSARSVHENRHLSNARVQGEAPVDDLIADIDAAVESAVGGRTLRELAALHCVADEEALPGDRLAGAAVPITAGKREGVG